MILRPSYVGNLRRDELRKGNAMQKEWNIQEYMEGMKEWVDLTPRTDLMTRSEMLLKLKELDNSTARELRGHNVVNNARHGRQ